MTKRVRPYKKPQRNKTTKVAVPYRVTRGVMAATVRFCEAHNLEPGSFVEAALVHELGVRLTNQIERDKNVSTVTVPQVQAPEGQESS